MDHKPQTPNNAVQQPQLGHNSGELNFAEVKRVWNKDAVILAELFQTVTQFPGKTITANTHWVVPDPNQIKLVPYNDTLGPAQTELKKLFAKGEIGIAIKHHSPHPDSDMPEQIKLQCTHIQIIVGVTDGVITINNPQNYQNGLFGDPSYPSIFIKPKFPEHFSLEQVNAYITNIRTWLTIANTFTEFPGNYNGSDPLTCINKDKVIQMGNALLGALQNNASDIAWLQHPDQQVYCAELALLSLNLGLHFPLNKKHLGQQFEKIKSHILSKTFLNNNGNVYAKLVDVAMASEELLSVDDLITTNPENKFHDLAVTPFSVADMIEQFIQRVIPRQELGETEGAKYQSIVFEKIKPTLKDFLEIEGSTAEQEFDTAINEVSKIVGTAHSSYSDFRNALLPVFRKLDKISMTYGLTYIPPHCFLVRATDCITKQKQTGLIGWSYVGHGIHSSILK